MQWPIVNLKALRVLGKVALAGLFGTTADQLLLEGSAGMLVAEQVLKLFGL